MARLGKEKQSILDVIYNCLYRQSENYITKAEYKKNDNFAGDNKMKIKKAAGAVSGGLVGVFAASALAYSALSPVIENDIEDYYEQKGFDIESFSKTDQCIIDRVSSAYAGAVVMATYEKSFLLLDFSESASPDRKANLDAWWANYAHSEDFTNDDLESRKVRWVTRCVEDYGRDSVLIPKNGPGN